MTEQENMLLYGSEKQFGIYQITERDPREIFDFLLRIVHQAVDFFFVILGQCRSQTVHQFFRCRPSGLHCPVHAGGCIG